MKDTHPEIEKLYWKMMMERSPSERFMMGISMFDTAKSVVMSSIINEDPGISKGELKAKLFLRFYGGDFSEEDREKIINVLKLG